MVLSSLMWYHRRLSLHKKVFFSSLSLLLLVLILNSIAYWHVFIPMFVDQLKTYSLRVAYYLATRCRPLILEGLVDGIKSIIVHRESIEYEIAYIFVTDQNNRILAHTFPQDIPPEIVSLGPPIHEEEIKLLQVQGAWIYNTAVVVKEADRPIGVIHVGMRKSPVDKMIRDMGVILGLLTLLILGLAVFLSQLAAIYVTTPLKRLSEAMKQLARGMDESLLAMLRSPRCWELKGCHRSECPAFGKKGEPCWVVTAPSLSTRDKSRYPLVRDECKGCKVYREAQGDEVAQLMEAFGEVLWSMRTKAEELSASERKRRLLFDYDPNGVFLVDPQLKRILEVNETATKMLGCTKEELLGKEFWLLFDKDDGVLLKARIASSEVGMALDIPKLRLVSCEKKQLFVNLQARIVELPETPGTSGGRCVLVRMVDVTQRLQEESLLIQASKMATLGEMATGVAHELNQPLNVLKVGADFFRKMAERNEAIPPEKFLTIARNMSEQVDRASKIIDHLREFGRKSEFHLYPTNINEAIRGAFTLLGQQLALREISVELNLQPDLPPILGDKNRLEQIFLNLITNARDAMSIKERVTSRQLIVSSFAVKDRVIVEVSDTGVGIPEENLNRIFEPFFTTKPPGEGTGLGLSITYNLVRDFKGTIEVQSKVGVGTTFLLSFPAYTEEGYESQAAASDR